jgi:hypothetical protein
MLAYFKTLPCTSLESIWAIYLLVLEKSGCRPKVYVGSGTDARRGVRPHFDGYDKGLDSKVVPKYVAAALKDGYEITHKGLLCWIDLPTPALAPLLRLVFYALESTFALSFWAMHSTTKNYGYGKHICLWDRDLLDWDGLCSHSALIETPVGDYDLSAEELEVKAAAQRERSKENTKISHARQKAADPQTFNAKMRANMRRHVARDRKRYNAKMRAWKAKKVAKAHATAQFKCKPCNRTYNDQAALDRHFKTDKHASVIAGTYKRNTAERNTYLAGVQDAHRASRRFYCASCDLACASNFQLKNHVLTARHKAKVAQSQQSSGSG